MPRPPRAHRGTPHLWAARLKTAAPLAALALALALPGVAHADPKDDARRHFVAGLEAAQSGQYEVALQHFLAAEEAYPHPATLYNIARAYQDLGDLENALTYYRLYRDADPSKAPDIDPTIAVIEARLKQESTPAPVVAPVATGGGGTVAGVDPEVVQRLQALAAEMQAKVDEVNALTDAIASGQASVPASTGTTGTTASTTGETGTTGTTGATGTTGTGATGTTGTTEVPALPEGGFITDAYQRVVVTASRYGQDPIDSPSAVTILTDEDIRMSPATNLPDLLRRVVGVDVMQTSAGQSDVSIRGFNRELNNKVLVLIDGRPTYLDFIGTSLWSTMPISLEEIERIEVVRGPGSAVYGANAVTGVINIITKTPGEGKNLVSVEAGTPGYGQGTAYMTGRAGATAYRFSGGYQQTGRWAKEVDPKTDRADVFPAKNQDLAVQGVKADGRLDRTFGASGFASVSGGYSDGTYEFYNIGVLGDYYIDLQHHYLRGDVAYGPVHLRAFWNSDTGTTGPWHEPIATQHSLKADLDADTYDVELEANQDFATGAVKHRLNGGVGWRYKTSAFGYLKDPVDGDDRVSQQHEEAFLQEQATVGKVNVVASLRADRHPLLPLSQTLSPRGAIIARVADKTSVRATGGTAFRAPNLIESYMDFDIPTTADGVYVEDFGSQSLKPERIVTAEVGLHDESTVYHTADVSLYYNRLTDIIFLSNVVPATDLAYNDDVQGYLAGTTGWTNTPAVYTGYGVEAETELYPADGLDVYANLDLQRIVEDDNGDVTPDKSTSGIKVNAGVMYRTPVRVDLTFDVNYVGAQTWALREFDLNTGELLSTPASIPARVLTDARVGYRPFKDDSLDVSINLWNIPALFSDSARFQEHPYPKGQPVGGRAYANVTYKF